MRFRVTQNVSPKSLTHTTLVKTHIALHTICEQEEMNE